MTRPQRLECWEHRPLSTPQEPAQDTQAHGNHNHRIIQIDWYDNNSGYSERRRPHPHVRECGLIVEKDSKQATQGHTFSSAYMGSWEVMSASPSPITPLRSMPSTIARYVVTVSLSANESCAMPSAFVVTAAAQNNCVIVNGRSRT